MKTYILAIDQGTTGTTALLMDSNSMEIVAKDNKEFPQIFPKPGWVEHNLDDIWKTVGETITSVKSAASINDEQILCIGITNQRETTCAFNSAGKPLHHALVWQDRRTSKFCSENKNREDKLKKTTGLPLDPYFSGTKMKWLLENSDAVKNAGDDLRLGTIDTFLLYKLTDGYAFKTEATNASRTLLMDLKTTNWDHEFCDFFGVSSQNLPEICDSFHAFGKTQGLDFLSDGIPITGILGDQQSALFGQAGLNAGDTKCTYGTGAFTLMNTGEEIKYSDNGLLTTVAYRENGKTYYALEGSSYIAGAAVQWLRDKLQIIDSSPEIEKLAKDINPEEQMPEVFFLPFFSGMGSPHWKPDAKAAILGLTRDSDRSIIARACLEGVAFSIKDLVDAFAKDAGVEAESLKVDGGMVANNLFCQIQADTLGKTVIRPKVIETTAFGAACAAMIGLEKFKKEEIQDFWKSDQEFQKQSQSSIYYQNKYHFWVSTIERLYP